MFQRDALVSGFVDVPVLFRQGLVALQDRRNTLSQGIVKALLAAIAKINDPDRQLLQLCELHLSEDAATLGANAVVALRITTTMMMQSAAEFLAYGTAVVVEE